jgi:hypothetical protein
MQRQASLQGSSCLKIMRQHKNLGQASSALSPLRWLRQPRLFLFFLHITKQPSQPFRVKRRCRTSTDATKLTL